MIIIHHVHPNDREDIAQVVIDALPESGDAFFTYDRLDRTLQVDLADCDEAVVTAALRAEGASFHTA